jgi:hypothetical protein
MNDFVNRIFSHIPKADYLSSRKQGFIRTHSGEGQQQSMAPLWKSEELGAAGRKVKAQDAN